MWYALVMKSKTTEEHYFLIHDPDKGLLFQSLLWINELECLQGVDRFVKYVRNGVFKTEKAKLKGGMYHREYRDQDGKMWGYGTAKATKDECKEEYKFLKNTLKEDGRIINQEDFFQIDSKILDFMYSLDGCGFETQKGSKVYEERQWANPDFIMWSNKKIKNDFFCKFFELP